MSGLRFELGVGSRFRDGLGCGGLFEDGHATLQRIQLGTQAGYGDAVAHELPRSVAVHVNGTVAAAVVAALTGRISLTVIDAALREITFA